MVDLSKRRWFTPNRQPNQSQVRLPWLARPDAFTDECTRCGKCVTACETHIIEKGDGGFPTVNFSIDECTFCYQCAQSCPEPLFVAQSEAPWQARCTLPITVWLNSKWSAALAKMPAQKRRFILLCKSAAPQARRSTANSAPVAELAFRFVPVTQ